MQDEKLDNAAFSQNSDETLIEEEKPPKAEVAAQNFQSADENEKEPDLKQSIAMSAKMGSFGLFFAFACIIGFVIGRWLDKQFGIYPWLTIFLTLCGVIASVIEFVKIVQKARRLS
ncbi:MAG: AtpZ/AtpI family protein [Bradymonadales bacterium]|jgi:F0F1-type ATP synthase assembly protein I